MILKIGIAGNVTENQYVLKNFELINSFFNLKGVPVFLDSHDLNKLIQMLLKNQIDCAVIDSDLQPELMIDKLDWFWMPYSHNDAINGKNNKVSIIFKKNDEQFLKIRLLFCKVVTFIGSGIGNADMCSVAGLKALKSCEVCLHDSLIDYSILDNLPSNAKIIDVGKRCGHHKMSQTAINDLIVKYAKMGFRVIRLKSGDPSIFGRLAEEVEALNSFHIPYRVIPGMSSLNAITANSGVILTRRGVNRGFCVTSAIKHGGSVAPINIEEIKKLPFIYYMGVKVVKNIVRTLIKDGLSPDTKAIMIFGIGSENETVIKGNLKNIVERIERFRKNNNLPGLFIVGNVAEYISNKGLLERRRILIVGCEKKSEQVAREVEDFDGIPVKYKINMRMTVSKEQLLNIDKYNFILMDEAESTGFLIKALIKYNIDIRKIPAIISAAQTVSDSLKSFGIVPTIEIDKIDKEKLLDIIENKKLLYIHSKGIFGNYATVLRDNRVNFKELVICENAKLNKKLPGFEFVLFLDTEHFHNFVMQQNLECLRGKNIIVENEEIKGYLSRFSINSVILKRNKGTPISPLIEFIIKSQFKSMNRKISVPLRYSSA